MLPAPTGDLPFDGNLSRRSRRTGQDGHGGGHSLCADAGLVIAAPGAVYIGFDRIIIRGTGREIRVLVRIAASRDCVAEQCPAAAGHLPIDCILRSARRGIPLHCDLSRQRGGGDEDRDGGSLNCIVDRRGVQRIVTATDLDLGPIALPASVIQVRQATAGVESEGRNGGHGLGNGHVFQTGAVEEQIADPGQASAESHARQASTLLEHSGIEIDHTVWDRNARQAAAGGKCTHAALLNALRYRISPFPAAGLGNQHRFFLLKRTPSITSSGYCFDNSSRKTFVHSVSQYGIENKEVLHLFRARMPLFCSYS